MTGREKRLYIFYAICFALTIISEMIPGMGGNSHTAPAAFLFEVIAFIIGLPIFLFDLIRIRPLTFKSIKPHVYGLGANGVMLLLTILPALASM